MDKLCKLIRTSFDWIQFDTSITSESRFIEDLCLDSVNLVTLQVMIEDEFHLRFDPTFVDFALVFSSVGAMANFIEKYSNLEHEYT